MKICDYVGFKNEYITVLEKGDSILKSNGKRIRMWKCRCDCGQDDCKKIFYLPTTRLKTTKSCGAMKGKLISEKLTQHNDFDISNEYGIGYTKTNSPISKNVNYFYFDLEDYDKIKDFHWRFDKDGYIYTITSGLNNKKTHRILLSRFVMNCPDNLFVDHITGSNYLYDNRKSNLRIVTKEENNRNRKMSKYNTSGVTGVSFDKTRNKWVAKISIKHKPIYLGRFDKFEDAVKARKQAEEKYYGEYSVDKSRNSCNV